MSVTGKITANIIQRENGIIVLGFVLDGEEYRGICLKAVGCLSTYGINPSRVPHDLMPDNSVNLAEDPSLKSASCFPSSDAMAFASSCSSSAVCDRYCTRDSARPLALNYRLGKRKFRKSPFVSCAVKFPTKYRRHKKKPQDKQNILLSERLPNAPLSVPSECASSHASAAHLIKVPSDSSSSGNSPHFIDSPPSNSFAQNNNNHNSNSNSTMNCNATSSSSFHPANNNNNSLLHSTAIGEFELGNMVWGKVTGYPYWPGRIHNILNSGATVVIAWLASSQISYLPSDRIVPFAKHFQEKFDKKRRGAYLHAVKLALLETNADLL